MSNQHRAVVVGAGNGGRLSMKALAMSDRYDLVGVADLREDARSKAEADFPGLKTFAEHRRMFDELQPDVMCISTFAPSHAPIVYDALEYGPSGLLVEKPLADTASRARELLEAIKIRRLPVVVPHNLLVFDHSRSILETVHRGGIGELKLVEIQTRGWDIINAGVHWLNFFVALVGEDAVESVMAACDTTSRTYRDGMQVETEGVTYVQTTSGVRAVMNSGDYVKVNDAGQKLLFRLVGTEGLIEFWGFQDAYRLVNASHPHGKRLEFDKAGRTGHLRHLENLATQMDAGEPDYMVADSALGAVEICEAAYLSHRHRCLVRFPLSTFEPPHPTGWDPGTPYDGQGGGRNGRDLPEVDPNETRPELVESPA